MRKLRSLTIAVSLLATIASTAPASALSIILRTDASFSKLPNGEAALFAFQKAANYWNKTITTDATLNFDVRFASLGAGILGGAFSNVVDTRITTVYQQLAATGNSALDTSTVANLKPLSAAGGLGYRVPGTDSEGFLTATEAGSRFDNNDSYNNLFLNANTSINKALGITFDESSTVFSLINSFDPGRFNADADGDITFSSNFDFDFTPEDGIDIGSFDFVAVAIHEMGHALGFVSGTDDYDFFAGPAGPGAKSFTAADAEEFSWASSWDLFRFGANNPLADGTRDLQLDPDRPAFFSIDGGKTPFVFGGAVQTTPFYSTGAFNGDGSQASHWLDAPGFLDANGCFVTDRQVGIMDPTANDCVNGIVTANDIAAFDAMGWNVNFNVLQNKGYTFDTRQVVALEGLALAIGVPEAGTWTMMIFGFGLVGASMRRRSKPALAVNA